MLWEEATWQEMGALDRQRTIVVLPVGSVEQHGHHMPIGTDTILAAAVAVEAAKLSGPKVVVLPSPWYGLSAHHMHFPGSVTLAADTMIAMVSDIVASVVAHGFRRIAIVNGHGGNAGVINVLASTLGYRFYGKARVVSLSYFALPREEIAAIRESRHGGTGHACEFETSMMLRVRPDLVHQERAVVRYPDPGSAYLSPISVDRVPYRHFSPSTICRQAGPSAIRALQARRKAIVSSLPASRHSPTSSRILRSGPCWRKDHERTTGRSDRTGLLWSASRKGLPSVEPRQSGRRVRPRQVARGQRGSGIPSGALHRLSRFAFTPRYRCG